MKIINNVMKLSVSTALIAAITGSLCAGPVKFINADKGIEYEQSSATSVSLLPGSWRPYRFSAEVSGERSAVAALRPKPMIKLPSNSKFQQLYNEKPTLGLSRDGWRIGYEGKKEFDDWGAASKSEIDKAFPNGTYVFTVQGKTINLSFPRDTYPDAPKLVLTGGRWVGGVYRIKANKALTVNSGIYAGYGDHINDYMEIDMWDDTDAEDIFNHTQLAKKIADGPSQSSANFIVKKVSANALKAGHAYYISTYYGAIVDQSTELPGAIAVSTYTASTEIHVEVEP